MNKLPQARNENVVVQNLDDEVLIYDLQTNKAVCLNSTSAIVFNHCDGKTTFDELKSEYKFSDDLIYFALDKLNESNLLTGYRAGEHFTGLSRREVIRRVGIGSMIALPVISALIAPSALHASSTLQANGATCTAPNQCQSGVCTPTFVDNSVGSPTTGNVRCCRDTTSVEPGNSAGNTVNGSCTVRNNDCCDGSATFNQTPGQPAGTGTCVC